MLTDHEARKDYGITSDSKLAERSHVLDKVASCILYGIGLVDGLEGLEVRL